MRVATSDSGFELGLPVELTDRLLDPGELAERQRRADRLLMADGAGHLVHDLPLRADGRAASVESRPWRIDPIPIVIDAPTFRWLSLAVGERMRAMGAVIGDLLGERRLVREGVVPAAALAATARFRINAVGSAPRRWLTTYAVDLVQDATGAWHVVADLTDAPAGLGYALLDRSVMARVAPDVIAAADVASLARYPALVRRALAAASDVASPRTVVFSSGLDDATYVDHSYLAVQLGVNLAEGPDLVVRQRRVWLRTLDGLEPVDVLYRRVHDAMVDPLEVAAEGVVGVPGLLQAVRAGNVVLANAHGAGLIEAESLRPYLAAAAAHLQPMEQALSELPSSAPPLATHPIRIDGGLSSASVVVRMFAVDDGTSVSVLPGGVGRVLAVGDDPRHPSAAAAKDVWVLGQTVSPVVGVRLPQVNFGRSVPTRAADALYWTNRAAERAEAMARAMRVITSRIEQDPGLLGMHGGAWTARMIGVASSLRRVPTPPVADPDVLHAELSALGDAVAIEIGSLLTEAATVREFLSVTTGRVLSHLAELRSSMQEHRTVVDDIDAVLADFAALAGLWRESTVRGPAWRIGDAGRRLERCLIVLDHLSAFVNAGGGVAEDQHDDVVASALEVLLASTESLVAYRRRYRSEVEVDAALDLVIQDASNPRSLAASIETLAEHARDGEWGLGGEFVTEAFAALELPLEAMIPRLRAVAIDGGNQLVRRWFSTPVNPVVMRPTGVVA